MTPHPKRVHLVSAVVGTAIITGALCLLAPLRQTSGDTVGGRLGGAVLRCGGGFDLSRVDWIRERTDNGKYLYWLQRDAAGEVTSIFGPGPAAAGAVALADFGPGDTMSDRALRIRERAAAAVLLAIASALLTLSLAARVRLRVAFIGGLTAGASFAGAATLGQGLWQATVALPCLMSGLAALAWRPRRPALAAATPAMLLVAVMLRPTILPLALGIGAAWCIGTRRLSTWVVASSIAVIAIAPLVMWNLIHLDSPFPAGQWNGNARMADEVFVFSRGHIGYALGGLLISPGRGLLWYAPIAVFGVVFAFRDSGLVPRVVAVGAVIQLLFIATFFKWYGGMAYGPRLLSEVVWVGIWLAAPSAEVPRRSLRALAAAALVVTISVGQVGLWLFRPEQWETRRMLLEIDENALWDFVDSPIAAAFSDTSDALATFDALPVESLTCQDGWIRSRRL